MLEEYWFSFVMLIAIMFLAYYATKFLGSKYNAMHASKYMNVVDRLPLDKDKSLVIVNIGKEQKAFILTPQGATMVALEQPLAEINTKETSSVNFQNILLTKFKKKELQDDPQFNEESL
ncbi:MAG: flagellar biosynthetic protein FliO [Erysipelotrichaceae bacterium]